MEDTKDEIENSFMPNSIINVSIGHVCRRHPI